MFSADFVREFLLFCEPVAEAVQDESSLSRFFSVFGYDLDSVRAESLLQQINSESPTFSDTIADLISIMTDGGDVIEIGRSVILSLLNLGNNRVIQAEVSAGSEFVREIFDYLLRNYLGRRFTVAIGALRALGILVEEEVPTTDPEGRSFPYVRVRFVWSRLGDFIRDNRQWAYDVYGWGGAPSIGDGRIFDHQLAILRLAQVVESTQFASTILRPMTATTIAIWQSRRAR